MTRIGAFAHRCNRFTPYSSFVHPNESVPLLTETKARSDYDVIEGNEAIWC